MTMNTTIQVKARERYGKWDLYPANDTAHFILRLLQTKAPITKCLNQSVLDLCEQMGYTVEYPQHYLEEFLNPLRKERGLHTNVK